MAIAEAQVRTIEVVKAEIQSYGPRISEAYGSGDFAEAQKLQAETQKLMKELSQLQSRSEQSRVLDEIRDRTYALLVGPVREAMSNGGFQELLAKAVNGGFTSYTISIGLPSKEKLAEDPEAGVELSAKFSGGARAPKAAGPRAVGATAVAVTIDGEVFENRAAVVDKYGNEHEKQLPAKQKSGYARSVLKRLADEGHMVTF